MQSWTSGSSRKDAVCSDKIIAKKTQSKIGPNMTQNWQSVPLMIADMPNVIPSGLKGCSVADVSYLFKVKRVRVIALVKAVLSNK